MREPNRKISPDEKAQILAMDAENISIAYMARKLELKYHTVAGFLRRHRNNSNIARAYINSKLDRLAKRVVKEADVDQCLEIFDRTETLVKKRDPAAAGGNQFVVCIGMPGSPLPIPGQQPLQLPEQSHDGPNDEAA